MALIRGPSWFTPDEINMVGVIGSDDLGLFPQNLDQRGSLGSGTVAVDDAPALAFGRQAQGKDLDHGISRIGSGGRKRAGVDGFLLGLHDARQAGIARFVETALGGDQGRQCGFQNKGPALDGPRAADLAIADRLGDHHGDMRSIHEFGHGRTNLEVVVVHGAMPGDDQIEVSLFQFAGQNASRGQTIQRLALGIDANRGIGPHGQGRAQSLDRFFRSHGKNRNAAAQGGFGFQGFFNGHLIIGVHHPVDPIGLDRCGAIGDFDGGLGRWNLFEQYGNFHVSPSLHARAPGIIPATASRRVCL
ncbi:hypothetical protein DESC_740223 [Desulfosarcina cetonica]|nr:hypothetical protein DESC_740223 [Desulfosarcina cetonica]